MEMGLLHQHSVRPRSRSRRWHCARRAEALGPARHRLRRRRVAYLRHNPVASGPR